MKLNKLLIVLCLITTVSVFAEDSSSKNRLEQLKDGIVKKSSIELTRGFDIPSRSFSFRVPKNAWAVRVSIESANADLDLFLKYGSTIDDFSIVDYSSEQDYYDETIFITRQSDVPLESGQYYVTAAYQYDYLPMVDGVNVEEVDFSIKLEIIKAEPEAVMKPDTPYTFELLPENGMFTISSIDIPKGTKSFRIDVYDTDADIDIFAALKHPAKSRSEALYASESMLGHESLLIGGYSDSGLVSGRYHITFLDQIGWEMPQKFSVIVTLDAEAPEVLKDIPKLPEPGDSFDSALLSTVEVISENGKGSGCLVSRDGYLITNWHVIVAADGNPSSENYIAFSFSNLLPPVESFSAEVIDFDKKLDLALLKINGGRYKQPLPYAYEFPYFRLGDPSRLRIGQPINILGYPEVGGTGSRMSITFTSGIVSGFEASEACNMIKTDALISSGNSGGAVIDAYYELLGFPGFIMDINNDKMGYVYPVSCLPEEWVDKINKANK